MSDLITAARAAELLADANDQPLHHHARALARTVVTIGEKREACVSALRAHLEATRALDCPQFNLITAAKLRVRRDETAAAFTAAIANLVGEGASRE